MADHKVAEHKKSNSVGMDTEKLQGNGKMYLMNLLHMSFSFFFVFTAFSAIQNLQTTFLEQDLVKTVSPAILYLVFTGFSIPGPAVVSRLGAKWSLFIAMIFFSTWCAANTVVIEYPENVGLAWGFLIPSSALVGLGASFLWVAQGSYLTRNAALYSVSKGMEESASLGFFNGIFFGIFQMTQISGNILASILLDVVGASKTVLFVIFLISAFIGTTLVFFLRDVPDTNAAQAADSAKKTSWDIAQDMIALWKDYKLQLLIPIIMYSGLEQGFIWGDFTANYITEGLGEDYIGYVMAVFGASDAVFSVLLGSVSDSIGRRPIIIAGAIVQLVVCALLFAFDVTEMERGKTWGLLIACAILWGIGDAVWNTQISATIGDVFREDKEGGFANLKFWQSLMVAIAFGYNFLFSSDVKLSILIVFGVMGVAGFLKITSITKDEKSKTEDLGAPLLGETV